MSRVTQEQRLERYVLFKYWAITIFGVPFQALLLNTHFVTLLIIDVSALQPRPVLLPDGLGFSAFARRYWRNTCLVYFPPITEMFHFIGFASLSGSFDITRMEFPHSEISGSKVFWHLPGTYRYHYVLHRLWEPRHPPYALTFLLGNVKTIQRTHREPLLSVYVHITRFYLHVWQVRFSIVFRLYSKKDPNQLG